MRVRILAVIVLFKLRADDSPALKSLLAAQNFLRDEDIDLDVILYDNTPGETLYPELPANVHYVHDGINHGLAVLYNQTISIASANNYQWMLTLDQDTTLPANALRLYIDSIATLKERPDVAAIVPQMEAKNRIVSPNIFRYGCWPSWFSPNFSGIPQETTFAFNSGSMLRVSALRQIGGYSLHFWFDNCDSYLYRELACYGKHIYVQGALRLQHDFSLMNLCDRVSLERYSSMLLSESAFWDLKMNRLAGCERTMRLAGRMVRHIMRHDHAEIRNLTLQALINRLFYSKSYRMACWKSHSEEHLPEFNPAMLSQGPERISVCMATHNGSRFIQEQLQSIADQLVAGDEIVVVDDASTDNTITRLRQFQEQLKSKTNAPQLILLEDKINSGVTATFERALRSASGTLLFLSDQDDRWAADKVSKFRKEFRDHPEADLIASNFQVIDENDLPVASSPLALNRKFSTGFFANLLHNQFQGATLAIRASLLEKILPFPKDVIFLHDRWIGALASTKAINALYIDEPLLLYRDHGRNYTHKMSLFNQAKMRLQLCALLLKRLMVAP